MATANRDALIGVDLGGTKVAAGKIVKGEIVSTLNEPIQVASEDLQETIALIKSVIGRLMDDHIAGIGIGVPGLVDRELGIAIKTIKMAVDPGMIIIGGSVAKARSLFEDAMWKSILDFSFPSALKSFRVEFSETTHAAIFGAAALHSV
jgi:predicted NBD/HSP70 family sugar kinase